jgi:hypothetical protein
VATIEGPIIVGQITTPLDPRALDVAKVGYTEHEWFASGTATRYTQQGERSTDGRWRISPDGAAPFRTRFIVRMPADLARFNGVVALEWLNVSALELAPDWSYLSDDALIGAGVAWVGVSAQSLPIEGGQAALDTGATDQAIANQGIKATNPERYASLVHPGDAYSFDIFSQVGAALRAESGRRVLGGAPIRRLIAVGESQSAGFLTAYINGVQPITNVFDGFFVHSRTAGAAWFDGTRSNRNAVVPYRIRSDLDVPVFVFETETDVLNGYALARQPDTEFLRVWEAAGTGHSDTYLAGHRPDLFRTPINDGPHHWIVKAAFTSLVDWVTDGAPPPHAEPIQADGTIICRDERGIALGGIRTPDVDVPVATLSGAPAPDASPISMLLGTTTPFDEATLRSLYPTKQAYVTKFATALDEAIRAGYVRECDRAEYLAKAQAVTIPS